MVPHGLRNAGEETLRVVGFFSSNVVMSTFDQPIMAFNQRTVGTPGVLEEEQVPTGDARVCGGKSMARIPTIDPEQTRGLRKLLFWVKSASTGE